MNTTEKHDENISENPSALPLQDFLLQLKEYFSKGIEETNYNDPHWHLVKNVFPRFELLLDGCNPRLSEDQQSALRMNFLDMLADIQAVAEQKKKLDIPELIIPLANWLIALGNHQMLVDLTKKKDNPVKKISKESGDAVRKLSE